jgi:hypothetical protein
MHMALDVMEAAIKAGDWEVDGACDPDWVLSALRARLAQPEREWQGLTDEQIQKIEMSASSKLSAIYLAEAQLKGKNGF